MTCPIKLKPEFIAGIRRCCQSAIDTSMKCSRCECSHWLDSGESPCVADHTKTDLGVDYTLLLSSRVRSLSVFAVSSFSRPLPFHTGSSITWSFRQPIAVTLNFNRWSFQPSLHHEDCWYPPSNNRTFVGWDQWLDLVLSYVSSFETFSHRSDQPKNACTCYFCSTHPRV